MLTRRSSERGFTLIETLAAITVFAIMTLGLAPLLASSLRGSSLSRSFTRGKNVADQAMERVRGLPYFVSGPTKVDVLDLYFPDKGAPGYVGGVYTTTCLPATASAACPAGSVPADHMVTYEAAFVRKVDSADPVEQYEVVAPPDGYSWDTAEKPPESLLRMAITARWTANNDTRSFTLVSLIGDRRFGGLKIDGLAVVDFAVQIRTAFSTADGQESQLTVIGGSSESRIESKLLTTAEQEVSAASLQLADTVSPDTASAQETGATTLVSAPPDGPVVSGNASSATLGHADFGGSVVAGVDSSGYSGVNARVAGNLPVATGSTEISAGGALALLWADNQAQVGEGSLLRLRDEGMVAWVRPNPVSPLDRLSASTAAETSPLATQQTRTTSSTEVGSFLLLPTTFIQDTSAAGAVVEVRGFEASATCTAKPSTGSASASWSATLRYWQDPADQLVDGGDDDSFVMNPGSYAEVPLGGQAGADRLEEIQGNPPIVYEDPSSQDPLGSPDDIYLLAPDPDDHDHASHRDDDNDPSTPSDNDDEDPETLDEPVQHNHAAYLADWTALIGATTDASQPQNTSATIGGAIALTTTATDPALARSVINVTLGSLSCRALDAR